MPTLSCVLGGKDGTSESLEVGLVVALAGTVKAFFSVDTCGALLSEGWQAWCVQVACLLVCLPVSQ